MLLAMSDVTRILSQIEQGDPQAAEQLLPMVYDELRKLAAVKLAQEKPGQTLQATALVHEAYVRLVGEANAAGYHGRRHFVAAAAEAMRRILVENARRKLAVKRGGRLIRSEANLDEVAANSEDEKLVVIDEALAQLALEHPEKAELVKLRYFARMTISQAAEALGISTATADRYWAFARAWLQHQISAERL
jgi:RNA polymerase sigma factor (TIGR02999 family)